MKKFWQSRVVVKEKGPLGRWNTGWVCQGSRIPTSEERSKLDWQQVFDLQELGKTFLFCHDQRLTAFDLRQIDPLRSIAAIILVLSPSYNIGLHGVFADPPLCAAQARVVPSFSLLLLSDTLR